MKRRTAMRPDRIILARAREAWSKDRETLKREGWPMPAWSRAPAWQRRPYVREAVREAEAEGKP